MASRVGRKPIEIPQGVDVTIDAQQVTVKGAKGELVKTLPSAILITKNDNILTIDAKEHTANGDALRGTFRALLQNQILGVSQGFTKKLTLVGVGYRAQAGTTSDGCHKVDLTLGLSHPVAYTAPKGIDLAVPSVTEITVSGIDKELVGQAAANIRGIQNGVREPEPYKGKGIRYADERILLKETKKK